MGKNKLVNSQKEENLYKTEKLKNALCFALNEGDIDTDSLLKRHNIAVVGPGDPKILKLRAALTIPTDVKNIIFVEPNKNDIKISAPYHAQKSLVVQIDSEK